LEDPDGKKTDTMNSKKLKFVGFKLALRRFAIRVENIERVIAAVEIRSIPQMPDHVKGIINLHGEIIPVIDIRAIFGLQKKEIELSDQFIIVNTSARKQALWVDSTEGITEVTASSMVEAEKLAYGTKYIEGVVKTKKGMILVTNIEKFLSPGELALLETAINQKEAI